MGSRETILEAIRSALAEERAECGERELPAVPEVWAMEELENEEMVREFETNLRSVAGELVRCDNEEDAADKAAGLLASLVDGPITVGVMNESETKNLLAAAKRVGEEFHLRMTVLDAPANPADADPRQMQAMDASLVRAELLLADTGSAVIHAASAFDRMLCYLSPACFVVARRSQLREHMPHAWPELLKKLDPNVSPAGEFLIVTGPSRTADIEKILVLGVHGPRKLVVLLLNDV
ncbi:MAG: LUD domain-containing protein [Planctomycetia bacterium]|nr:LUD domain-containing protein [Planctomycetia bacterium]